MVSGSVVPNLGLTEAAVSELFRSASARSRASISCRRTDAFISACAGRGARARSNRTGPEAARAMVLAGMVFSYGRRRSERPVQPQRLRKEDRHLAACDEVVRAVVSASASAGDPGRSEGLDVLERGIGRRNVSERSRLRRRGDLTAKADQNVVELDRAIRRVSREEE